MTRLALAFLLAACLGCQTAPPRGATAAHPTAILGAFGPEVRQIEQQMTQRQTQTIDGLSVSVGKLHGRDVVVAQTGVGKVNAAMTTALVIDRYQPAEIIFSGIAGGISTRVHPGDIVIATKIAQHDFGTLTDRGLEIEPPVSPITGQPHPPYLPADPRLLAAARAAAGAVTWTKLRTTEGERAPAVLEGVIVTGDVFVASSAKKAELRARLQADAVEMEGAAVAQVAAQLGVPCLVIRSISDMADEAAAVDMQQFLEVAARNSAQLVGQVAAQLAAPPPVPARF